MPVAVPGVVERIERQMAASPERPAIMTGAGSLSYGELERRSAVLAADLRARGLGPDGLVAIAVERDPSAVMAILAVLRAGGGYVPIDPQQPRARIERILAETDPVALLVRGERGEIPVLPGRMIDLADERARQGPRLAPAPRPPPDAAAYVIYTSGSTGAPKGVLVTRRGLDAQLAWMQDEYRLEAHDRFLQLSWLMFDFSVIELLWPLMVGGAVVLPRPGGELDLGHLAALAREAHVTTVHFVPSMLRVLLDEQEPGAWRDVTRVFSGGEALPAELARRCREVFPGAELHNQYGPTETTINATYWKVEWEDDVVPIGRAVGDTPLFVLDDDLQPVAPGMTGELFIGGVQLARGYLRRPGDTAARFVPSPFSAIPGERLYRTGDRVRTREDGALEYLGRTDGQVKLRGFRIELGEIEAALRDHPSVAEAVCTLRGGVAPRLVAHVMWRRGRTAGDLDAHLRARLPAYMVPAAIVLVDEWPLTPGGKLDRAALPAPPSDGDEGAGPADPLTPSQELVARVWREVLGVPVRGAEADFFQLGGDSLAAMRAAVRIDRAAGLGGALGVVDLLRLPRLRDLAARIEGAGQPGAGPTSIPPAPRDRPPALSSAQEGMWILEQLDPGVYGELVAIDLVGPLDVNRLRRCLTVLVRRHEVLRSVFVAVDGAPVVRVVDEVADPLSIEPGDAPDLPALALIEAARPIDLERGPLIRFVCARRGPDRHVLLYHVHHLVFDGSSEAIVLGELAALYAADAEERGAALAPLPVQYGRYAAWQRSRLDDSRRAELVAHWTARLADAPAALELPTDHPRPPRAVHRGERHRFEIDAGLAADLRRLGREHGATPFMTLLALFHALLCRVSGQRDVVIGTPVSLRDRAELEPLVGLLVDTLPIRLRLDRGTTVGGALESARRATADALAHRDLPFEDLVAALAPRRDPARHPIFQVGFVLEPEVPPVRAGELELSVGDLPSGASKFDLTLKVREQGDRLRGELEYASELFSRATVEALARRFLTLAREACRRPDRPIARLELLDERERRELADEPARRIRWDRKVPSVLDQVERAMSREPDRPAVLGDGEGLSYGELDRRSRLLGDALVGAGLGPDRLVAIVAERSPEVIVAMIAALRSGGGYVPISPRSPLERIARLVRETRPVALLGAGAIGDDVRGAAGDVPVLDLSDQDAWRARAADRRRAVASPDALAYVIYTSGSTGLPKGVMVPRRGFDAQLSWMQERYRLEARDRFLQLSSLTFDFSVIEVFWPLMVGGAVVLPRPGGELDPEYLGAVARGSEVTAVHFVPSMLRVLLEETRQEPWRSVTRVFSGGEALAADLARRCAELFPGAELHNQYGPTETTINATACEVAGDVEVVPIGSAVADTSLFVLDGELQPVPPGAVGELFVGGVQLARGYVGQPAETAARFVPSPFAAVAGERLYRTGDLVRQQADGDLEYLGRSDHQIKLRGFRVELGEVEAALRAHPSVSDAVCVVRGQGGESGGRLVAYVQWRTAGDAAMLDEHLGRLLPDYMIPSAYAAVERWPLTASGKLDRAALPPVTFDDAAAGRPMSDDERIVAAIWSELLEVEIRSPQASFFDLGGTSIEAMRATARLNRATGRNLPFLALFEARTVERVAALLASGDGAGPPALPPLRAREDRTSWPLTFSQRMAWELTHRGRPSPFELPRSVFEVRGPLDRGALRRAVGEVLGRHAALRARFAVEACGLVQRIASRPVVDWRDLAPLPPEEEEDAARSRALAAMAAQLHRPFDLEAGPIIRFALASASPDLHWFGFSVHHIAFDGGSMAPFVGDLSRAYREIAGTGAVTWEPPAIELADVAAWEQEVWRVAGGRMGAYWRRVLDGATRPALPMSDWSGEDDLSPDAAVSCSFTLGAEHLDRLRRLATALGSTPFLVALTSLGATCRALTGSDDYCIASPTLRREADGTEDVVGYVSHPLLLRLDWPRAASFAEAVARAGERALGAYQHGHLPLYYDPAVFPGLPGSRGPGRDPLYRVFFNFLDLRRALPDLGPGLRVEVRELPEPEARSPLMIYAVVGAEELTWSFLAQARCYDPDRLQALAERVAGDLRAVLEA